MKPLDNTQKAAAASAAKGGGDLINDDDDDAILDALTGGDPAQKGQAKNSYKYWAL